MRLPGDARPWSEITVYSPKPENSAVLGQSGEVLDVSRIAISATAREDYSRFYPFDYLGKDPATDSRQGDRGRRFPIFDALARSVQLHPCEAESLTARPTSSRTWYFLHPERSGIFVVLPRQFVASPIRERNPRVSGLLVTFVTFGLAQFREAVARVGPGSPLGPGIPWRVEAVEALQGLVETVKGSDRATVACLRYEAAVGRLLGLLELQGGHSPEIAAVRAARDEWIAGLRPCGG